MYGHIQSSIAISWPSFQHYENSCVVLVLCCRWFPLGLGTHLFVKVPQPGDSEVTFSVFESSCHLLLPV